MNFREKERETLENIKDLNCKMKCKHKLPHIETDSTTHKAKN